MERNRIDHIVKLEIERGKTAIWFEQATKELEIQQNKLSPEYLKLKLYEESSKALSQNTKIYFGERIPNLMVGLLPNDMKSLITENE